MGRLGRTARRAGIVLATAVSLALFPSGAAGTVTGGCLVTGTSTSGGSIDLTTAAVWHVRSSDTITISASAPFEQFHGSASAQTLGLVIPLASGESTGERAYASDSYQVSTLALLGRIFVISGSSSSAFHGCNGQVELVIDDANPVLTVLGGGAILAAVLGLLALAWALRGSSRTGRRVVGLIGFAFIGAGAALLLQQTSTPGEGGAGVSGWVASVASPQGVSVEPLVIVESAALSLLLLVLMPFPSELFNRTLESNLPRLRASLRRVSALWGLAGRGAPDAGDSRSEVGWRHPLAVATVVLAAGLLYGFLDPDFGPTTSSLVAFLAIVAGLVSVRGIANLPRRAVNRSLTGDAGHLRAVPGTLLVAAACVLISRLVSFEPGYLYGLVFGYSFAKEISATDEGRALAAGGWWQIGVAFVAWLTLGALHTPGVEPTLATAIVTSVLAALVVAGIEGIVFGMVPLRFLHGELVFRWRRSRWALLYATGLFAFFWIILDPAHGFLEERTQGSFLTSLALFVGFGLVSVLFWAYFRARPAAVAAPESPV